MAENALLRQQLSILRRQVKRPACTSTDRMLLVRLARIARTGKQALFIMQPETLLRWHRQGFKLYWKYMSRAASAKPKISASSCRRSSWSMSFTPLSSTSIEPGRIKASTNSFQNSLVNLLYQITMGARSSPSQSWVDDTTMIAEVLEL